VRVVGLRIDCEVIDKVAPEWNVQANPGCSEPEAPKSDVSGSTPVDQEFKLIYLRFRDSLGALGISQYSAARTTNYSLSFFSVSCA
jgi:hypothetical protein